MATPQQLSGKYTEKDHTFVICAYGRCKHLEQCVRSLLAQEVLGNIIISTATPNEHIKNISDKYGLELRVNTQPPGISSDWNFAYKQAGTKLITLAHQDDIYLPGYLGTALDMINKSENPIIFFSHYAIIENGEIIHKNRRLSVRKAMLRPLKMFQKNIFVRRRLLSLANVICCPSVMYVNIKELEFSDDFLFCLDWQKWEELSRMNGSFVCCDKPLIYHRLHKEGETAKAMQSKTRRREDFEMFKKFWWTPIAWVLMKLYSKKDDNSSA